MAVEFGPSTSTQNTPAEASTSGASASSSTKPVPAARATNYARDTPSFSAKTMKQMAALDDKTDYKSHALKALRTTIGPIPMDVFFRDAKLCPPSPVQCMPDVPDDVLNGLEDNLEDGEVQRVVVSHFRLSLKNST